MTDNGRKLGCRSGTSALAGAFVSRDWPFAPANRLGGSCRMAFQGVRTGKKRAPAESGAAAPDRLRNWTCDQSDPARCGRIKAYL